MTSTAKLASDSRLIDHARDHYSQNGEDGVVARIFQVIGTSSRRCCEFGAWDGKHLSNTRALLLNGWSGVMIEADAPRFSELERTYASRGDVTCLREMIGVGEARLKTVLERNSCALDFDFVSIDIDGLDYEIFEAMGISPRVVCVEVNAGHSPASTAPVPRGVAERDVGQPLGLFAKLAGKLGYRLVCYTANAFLVHESVGGEEVLPTLTPEVAYEEFVARLDLDARKWMYRVNRALAPPFHRFENPLLTARHLGLSRGSAAGAVAYGATHRVYSRLRSR
jgi:hypothetical protein